MEVRSGHGYCYMSVRATIYMRIPFDIQGSYGTTGSAPAFDDRCIYWINRFNRNVCLHVDGENSEGKKGSLDAGQEVSIEFYFCPSM